MNQFVGNYKILRTIGKGGMGEVFLAHDPVCGRDVALKQMHPKWVGKKVLQERFLREARIASQLSHPSIIPIYSIDEMGTYYTMPYVEGETLKSILRTTSAQLKSGQPLHPIGASVPSLVRIFMNICGAVAYAHARGFLHRDLKPENIIVGRYREVIILDWGLADYIAQPERIGFDLEKVENDLTQPGKIPGTIQFMAPERIFEKNTSVLLDIYSLGVILYQMLTLKFPFHRTTLKEFRKNHIHEQILDPEEVAPDREISPHLSSIVKKCLEKNPEKRYQSVDNLIRDLEGYIEGRPSWKKTAFLKIDEKKDWRFQENIALAKHMALTRGVDMLEWCNLMLAKEFFPGNIRLEATLSLKEESHGLGLLFCLPEKTNPHRPEEGYLLWIGGKREGTRLYRQNVEVLHYREIYLEPDRSHKIRIEKIDNTVYFYLDNQQKFSFLNHIPIQGPTIGLIMRDGDFALDGLQVSIGSQNIMVNCLAVPDAFFSHQDLDVAYHEYQKIADSFPGRAEGREATFRAGLTLLEKAKTKRKQTQKQELFNNALDEFERLRATPGAPLEYLGKSFVYKQQGDVEEEAKCFELSLRKYPKHPLKTILEENILSRLHESAQTDRLAAYHFALTALRHMSKHPETDVIFSVLEKHLEPLPFFLPTEKKKLALSIQLAFWLNKPMTLVEMLEKGLSDPDHQNAEVALLLLGHDELIETSYEKMKDNAYLSFNRALMGTTSLEPLAEKFSDNNELLLWSLLHLEKWDQAKDLIQTLPQKDLTDENHPLFFLVGCFLAKTVGKAEANSHLTSCNEKAYPPTSLLLSHYLMGRINLKSGWIDKAFFWEKLKLYQQLHLFYHCLGESKQKTFYSSQIKRLLTNSFHRQ